MVSLAVVPSQVEKAILMDEEASAILTATAITTSMAAISTVRRAFRSDYMALRIRTAPATPAATTIGGATGFRLLGAIHTKRTAEEILILEPEPGPRSQLTAT